MDFPFKIRPLLLCVLIPFVAAYASARSASPTELTEWRSGLVEPDEGWVEHDGDDLQWARPDYDDSQWNKVNMDDLGPAQKGRHWCRQRIKFGPDSGPIRLLLAGGSGTYELYANGVRVPAPKLRRSLMVFRPVETVFPSLSADGTFQISLRTYVPAGYAAWHLPQFTGVTIGLPTVIEYERQALEGQRTFGLAPAICINVLLLLAGMGSLALYFVQREQREYLFLGSYLLIVGISNCLSTLQSSGFVPLSANFLIADPLIYAWVVAQVEFTYSFAGQHTSRVWRVYEISLGIPLLLGILTWSGHFSSDIYVLIEAAVTAPVGLLLSVLLLY